MSRAAIIVDLWHRRCSNCKVALHDDLAIICPVCSAKFDIVTSNHVGLGEKLHKRREAAGIRERAVVQHDSESLDAV